MVPNKLRESRSQTRPSTERSQFSVTPDGGAGVAVEDHQARAVGVELGDALLRERETPAIGAVARRRRRRPCWPR